MTANFTKCAPVARESFLAMCLMDLPFTASGNHDYKANDGRGVTITAASNLVLFKKEIRETDANPKNDIMIIHRYN